MINYFQWVEHQLYLTFFSPTRLISEVVAPLASGRWFQSSRLRFGYMVRMLPVTTLFFLALSGAVGLGYDVAGLYFRYVDCWVAGVPFLVCSAAIAVGVRNFFWWHIGIAWGSLISVFLGIRGGLPPGFDFWRSAEVFPLVGALLGVSYGTLIRCAPGEAAAGATGGVAYGVVLGVGAGVMKGVGVGVIAGFFFLLFAFHVPTFLLSAVLGWRCLLDLQRSLTAVSVSWRRHPMSWNEFIWLPLPGATRFLLLLACRDRAFGIKTIAFVMAERLSQRRAAIRAVVQIVLDDLGASGIDELTRRRKRLDWLVSVPIAWPIHFGKALPGFLHVAGLLNQLQSLDGRYLQRQLFEEVAQEMETICWALRGGIRTAAEEGLLRRAEEWSQIIDSELNQLDEASQLDELIPQVFCFGLPVRENEANVFAGRNDIVREFEKVLTADRHPPPLLLRGARRMGKSSVLAQLPRLLGPNLVPCLIDCQNPALLSEPASFLWGLGGQLSAALNRRGIVVQAELREHLHYQPYEVFDTWLREVEKMMGTKFRVLLCFDEYEALRRPVESGWGMALLDYFRHLCQHRPNFVLLFTGTHSLAELGREWTSRFVNLRTTRISFLTFEEFQPILERPLPDFPLQYAPGALSYLFSLSRGQPFLTQAIAKEMVDLLNDARCFTASVEHVRRAANVVLDSAEAYFQNVWDDAEEDGQALLAGTLDGVPAPECQTRLRLREFDVLDDSGRIAVPLLEQWVRRKLGVL